MMSTAFGVGAGAPLESDDAVFDLGLDLGGVDPGEVVVEIVPDLVGEVLVGADEYLDQVVAAEDAHQAVVVVHDRTSPGRSWPCWTGSRTVRGVFPKPLIQRRQEHKIRDVQDRLPDKLRSPVAQRVRAAGMVSSAV
ncbi:hypothetical protein [Nonomuraea sp. CA-141351]|uniref:hypothetical protein n=1 Tax=Nonomuraea sp. CA-141351 TaxID=3239996 RepID=UPI003D906B9D